MIWCLMAIKGEFQEIPFFKDNTDLTLYLKERDITFVSSLDDLDLNDLDLRLPIHQFLRGFYPFYREQEPYETHQNGIVDGIIQNIKNPEYLNFLFKELRIHGSDGPYLLVFQDDQLKVKFLGDGGWNPYAIYRYIESPYLFPPKRWPQDPATLHEKWLFQIDYTKKDSPDKSSKIVSDKTSENIQGSRDESIILKHESPTNSSSKGFGLFGFIKKQLKIGENTPENIEAKFHETYGEIPADVLRLIETIREHQLELGFQQLLQIIHLNQTNETSKPKLHLNQPASPPILTIDSEYNLVFSDLGTLSMEPLHKALYLLFLQQPEGINLYNLFSYKSVLREYYKRLSQRESVDKIEKSIERLVNRFDNSIYEKISRINQWVKVHFHAKDQNPTPFLILGKRGEPKLILGSKDLVIWEV